MESQKKLMTGRAGIIGTNLVNDLRKWGYNIRVVDLYNTERKYYIRSDVRSFRNTG